MLTLASLVTSCTLSTPAQAQAPRAWFQAGATVGLSGGTPGHEDSQARGALFALGARGGQRLGVQLVGGVTRPWNLRNSVCVLEATEGCDGPQVSANFGALELLWRDWRRPWSLGAGLGSYHLNDGPAKSTRVGYSVTAGVVIASGPSTELELFARPFIVPNVPRGRVWSVPVGLQARFR